VEDLKYLLNSMGNELREKGVIDKFYE